MNTTAVADTTAYVDEQSFQEYLDGIRRFVQDSLIPREAQLEEANALPAGIMDEMRDLGIFGMSIAPEYGGLGLTMLQEVRMHAVLSEAAQGFRYAYGTNVGIGSRALTLDGTQAQRDLWLPRIATGEIMTAFCATEPDAGSDLGSIKTRAVKDGDDYIVSGTKRFITNADTADLFTVLVRTGDSDGPEAISALLIEREHAGIEVGKPEKKLGQHGGSICDVMFDQVRVPARNLIGGTEGKGLLIAKRTLSAGRLSVAANSLGQMRRAIDVAALYASERQQFGKPISQFQLVQALLADSETDWFASHSAVLEAARQYDSGTGAARSAACAKYFASEALGRVADRCLQVLGGAGYIADYPLERIFRDARVSRIYEGTSQIMQLVIARDLLRQYRNQ